jgi:hypothetical protein
MNPLRYARAPLHLAFRRMWTDVFSVAALVAALTGAGALIGWSSLTSALAQEKSVRLQLRSVSPKYRSIHVRYYTLPLEADFRATPVAHTLQSFAGVTTSTRRVQVWHSIEANPQGRRLVIAPEPRQDVVVEQGRLPAGCRGRVCEALVLTGRERLGQRVPLGKGRFALIVGSGSLKPEVLPDRSELGKKALLVRSGAPTLGPLVREDGSTVVYSAPLDPERVHGFALAGLSERLRRAIIRLERGDSLVRATAPLATLDNLAERGQVARERLLLVAGQAAALVIAFAAFVASARRRETELLESQLTTLGGSRWQVRTARLVEALVPAIAAVVLTIGGLLVAARVIAARRGLPFAFMTAALPLETLVAIVAAGTLGFGLLLASLTPLKRSRFGVGTLELAAVTALAVVVWETWTTGALDPERVAGGGSPVILVLPALGFFAAGVLLLRLLPVTLRAGERVARHGPVGVRLAFLGAARSPAQAAAATTFLAIALGSALFSLNYRATLEQQAHDQAQFTAGARWRIVERGRAHQPDVTPVTRFARLTSERPTPVLRLDGEVVEAYPEGGTLPVRVLAVPAARLRQLFGWRENFSSRSMSDIADRLRPRPVHLTGPRLARDANELRVWARAQTDYPRRIVLHLLLPGQNFAQVRLGVVWRRWRLLRLPLAGSLRGAELVGLEYAPTYVPTDFKYDPKGFVDLGRIEQHRGSAWSPLPSLARWTQTTSPDGTAGLLLTRLVQNAPIARSLRFDLNGTFQPLIHPKLGLPLPEPGFENGPVPALASRPVAAQAVDGLLTIDLPGKQIAVHVAGRARLFPTITEHQSSFVVLDYDTLFAVMNADQPGLVAPSEAWFFQSQRRDFAARLARPPFRLERIVYVQELRNALLNDPLAAGTRTTLGIAGLVAAVLSLIGLVLAARSALVAERLQIAEYEALGVARSTLRRSAQLRLVALSSLGVAAGLLGGFASVRLTGAFVAVTGTAKRPLPPIATVVAWPAAGMVVGAVALAGAAAAALVARHALRESTARRLRA